MSSSPTLASEVEPLLSIPGLAADHLYREGSAKASFWEALFGSSLRAKTRTHVSARADGTRCFDVPLLGVEGDLLQRAQQWMASSAQGGDSCREALAAIGEKGVRVKLVGLQPRGQAVASFFLRFEPSGQTAAPTAQAISSALRSWFAAEGSRVSRDILTPFGFTPHIA